MKKELKNSKGITLIALVVTIVVLLILAGITITLVFSENGIIKKAQEAADSTKEAEEQTTQGLQNLIDQMNNAIEGNTGSGGDKPGEDEKPTISTKGELVLESIRCATYTDNTGSVPIPGGYCVVKDYTRDGVLEENKVGTGLVISDVENDDLNNTAKGNQFVWVPVPDDKLSTMYDEANNAGKLYEYTAEGRTEITYPGKNTDYREPDIVTGNDSGTGTDSDGSSTNLSILGLSSSTAFATQLQTEFDQMIESVKKYKGFYIGRYETGNLIADKNNTPVVKKGDSKINNVNWYYMYQTSKNIKKNNNVASSMIWGCQWDRTMQWLVETPNNGIGYSQIADSTSWGNHNDYSTTTGDTSTASGGSSPQISGTNEHWKTNNIYDLAGNVWEWTLESYNTNSRVFVGGSFDTSGSSHPVSRCAGTSPGPASNFIRLTFHTFNKSVALYLGDVGESPS